jgi:hypothetical protein
MKDLKRELDCQSKHILSLESKKNELEIELYEKGKLLQQRMELSIERAKVRTGS